MTDPTKKLTRPLDGRMIAGVCAGVARHFGIDATLVRVAWVLLFCLAGTGGLAYLLCWLLIPADSAPPGAGAQDAGPTP